MKSKILLFIAIITLSSGCNEEFLDVKPNSAILNPTTLNEFQQLLDNFRELNTTGGIQQMSSDDYFIVDKSRFDALTNTQKGAYLWSKDLYAGDANIQDWNQCFNAIFYSNSVLDGLDGISLSPEIHKQDYENLKGQALFYRAYAYFDLARNFSPVYSKSSSESDLGLPIRLSSGIDVSVERSTLGETFSQIISDLKSAELLLKDEFSQQYRNRPSKVAVAAMLARVYLYMGDYNEALNFAQQCLSKYNKLIDYNGVDTLSLTPFSYSTEEIIFFSYQQTTYSTTTGYGTNQTSIGVNPELLALYKTNDLRFPVFFIKNSLGNYNVRRGYVGGGLYPFTGLATDEILLIKAECLARANRTVEALEVLNSLLIHRFKEGLFIPVTADSAEEALGKILIERRKELVWRALRWSDLKRLNRDGFNVTLQRSLDGETYTLLPNSPLYVFPIPEDEIALSGIKQNIRE